MKKELTVRSVANVIPSIKTFEGEGFPVQRAFPSHELTRIDPFLMLDEMGPVDAAPGEAKGAPDHPHRGFETVTYMFSGSMVHKDSHGNIGRLDPGGVQWMTAGSGIIHSEMPSEDLFKTGGRFHGVQLWVNLPKKNKMMQPRYQDFRPDQIASTTSEDGLVSVRVLAGEALGIKASTNTVIPITYLDFKIQPGGSISQILPPSFNAFAYVIDGRGTFGSNSVQAEDGHTVLFSQDGDEVKITVSESESAPLHVLLIAGEPIHEPIVQYGPFVMNTEEEIYETIQEYRLGRFGTIPPQH